MNGHATMNRCFRVVWNAATAAWQAVAETASSGGKTKSSSRLQRRSAAFIGAAALAAAVPASWAQSLPTGGNIIGGSGNIATSGTTMTITQNTAKLAADWQSFNIGKGNTVNFVQPSASAVALNRVLGTDVSVIQGAINANGQVFLLNPNGVLFTPTAQVNVGGIVASTLNMSTADFMAGNYKLSGSSSNAVVNQGNITAVGNGSTGGSIALIAAKISNDGTLSATGGSVQLAAASDVTLDLGGPVKLVVNKGALDAQVANGGAIDADGGTVYLTARAVDALTSAVINNTGVIRAHTLATGEKGEIRLIADMTTGTLNVGGTLDASAPNGKDGGFIETSASLVNIGSDVHVTTLATAGKTGTWLIDPDILQIVAAGGAGIPGAGGGTSQISTATLNTALQSSNVNLQANQYIDLKSQLTYDGARAAVLGLYAPLVGLGADISSTNAALGLTFGGPYAGTNYTGNANLYGGARTLATHGGDVVFNGNLGGSQNLTVNTRGASASGKITHNALVNGGFSTLTGDNANPIHNYVALADTSGGVVTLEKALNVSGSIDISAKQFVNNAGASALQAGAGKVWRVWSTNATPYDNTAGDTIGALAYSFKQYGASYGASTPAEAGNAYLLSVSPTVTLQIATPVSKTYNGNALATLVPGDFAVQAGAVGGDSVSLVNANLPTTGAYNSQNVDATTVTATVSSSAIGATKVIDSSVVKVYGYQVASTATGAGQINPATASLSAVKVYNGSASLAGSQITVSGVNGETLSWSGSGTATASSAVVADNSTNYLTSIGVLTLADGTLGTPGLAGNYVLPSLLSRGIYNTVAINPANLTVLGVSGSRYYNGNSTFYAGLELRLGSGVVVGDIVTLNGYANVVSKDVGTYAQWASTNLYLADRNAANYTLSGGLISAVIMPAPLGISLTGIYSGSTTLLPTAFSTYGLVNGETITGLNAVLNNANVSANGSNYVTSAVATVGTASLTNYKITQAYNLAVDGSGNATIGTTNVATITPKAITATGVSAADKVYNATTAASIDTSAAVLSTEAVGAGNSTDKKSYTGDAVTLVTTAAAATFADKNVGRDKAVTVTGYTLSGVGAGNYSISDASSATADITPKAITASGVTGTTKVYDATTAATLNLSAVVLKIKEAAGSGMSSDNKAYTGDMVALVTTGATGTFADKNAGTGKAFTITGYTLSGSDAGNYTISDASAASGSITAKAITASGVSASTKVYDATKTASIDTSAAALTTEAVGSGTTSDNKAYSSDTVTLVKTDATATFDTKNVGTGKAVAVVGFKLSGADALNYSISDASSATANITQKAITASGVSASTKVYDATKTASIDTSAAALTTEAVGSGTTSDNKAYSSDTVTLVKTDATATFDTKNVGTGKAVAVVGFKLSGADALNYSISDASSATANITPKAITASGVSASTKVYDATKTASIDTSAAALTTEAVGSGTTSDNKAYSSDTVTLVKTDATATFDTKNVGTGKAVAVVGFKLSGADALNYSISDASSATANITQKAITASGVSASTKVYDATKTASIDTSAAALTTEAVGSGTTSDNKAYSSDTVTLVKTDATATFDTKNVGTGKAVAVVGFKLSGADALNYSISDASSATANITPKAITASGVSASTKVYDATKTASIDTSAAALTTEAVGSGTTSDNKAYSSDTVTLVKTDATATFDTKNVGTGKAVAVVGFKLSGADALNYSISDASSATANITPKAITASGVSASTKVYDATKTASIDTSAAALTTEAVGSGTTSDNKAYSSDTVTLVKTDATATFDTKNVGTGKAVAVVGFKLSGADALNYSISDASSATANITQKAITASGVSASTKVYDATKTASIDTSAAALTTEAVGSGTTSDNKAYSSDTVTLVKTDATATFDTKNVGTGKAVAVVGFKLSGADALNYSISDASSATANITPKAITASGVSASTKVYDATKTASIDTSAAALTTEAVGSGTTSDNKAYSSDTVTLVKTDATATFDTKNVGTGKAVAVVGFKLSGADALNYSISDASSATANITPKAITASGVSASTKVYDATKTASIDTSAAALTTEAVGSGTTSDNKAYSSDTVTLVKTDATATFDTKNVGTGKAVAVVGFKLSGADALNYSISDASSATANITPKAITASGVSASTKVYDATKTASIDTSAAALTTEAVGSGTTSDNKAYSSDTVTLVKTDATATFDTKNVGTGKAVAVVGFKLSGADALNYSISDASSATANITPKAITASGVSASTKVYDATKTASIDTSAAALTTEAVGSGTTSDNKAYSSDTVTLVKTDATATFDTKNVGTGKAVAVVGFKLSGADALNYSISDASSATANITPKAITASGVSASTKVYDATKTASIDTSAAALTTEAVGSGTTSDNKAYSSDTVTLVKTDATATFDTKNVGTGKAVAVVGFKLSGADALNYSISDASSATANITPKAITASGVSASTKVYDATKTASIDTSAAALTTEAVGSGTTSDNKAYSSDTVTLVKTDATATFDTKNVGTGKAVAVVGFKLSGADALNYSISDASSATANITQKAITASGIAAQNKVYNATQVATLVTANGVLSTETVGAGTSADNKAYTGDDVSLAYGTAAGTFSSKDVGTGKSVAVSGLGLSGTAAGNYTISDASSATADITQKAITASGIAAQNKVYDATQVATLDTANGVLGTETAGTGTSTDNKAYMGDDVSLAYGTAAGTFSSKDVRTDKSVAISGLSLSGTAAGNYTISDASSATANITAAPLTITALTNTKTYSGNTSAEAMPTVSGLKGSDTVTGLAETYDTQNAGTGKTMTVSAYTVNDGNSGGNYTVTAVTDTTGVINKAGLGVDVNGRYNGTTGFTTSNATIVTNGLVGGETLTSVTVQDANVFNNGSNVITAFTGGTASLGNYQISASTDTTSSGVSISTTHNNATIARAPLGVTVTGAYNGTTKLEAADGATITGYGLLGQDTGVSLETATLDSKNVANATKVLALTGSGTFDQRNYVLDGSINTTGGTGTAGTAFDGSRATNTATLARAALGVDVSGTYNGTTGFTTSNATLTANGLLGSDTLTGVMVRDANVFSNGSNVITAFTGGTASLGNYQISASTDTTSSGASISTTHNNASIGRAPLGVTVAGTYNGTDVMSAAAGATITGYGLVGQDANAKLSTATLDSKNVADATKVLALTGSGTFDQRNYVLDGSMNATGGTATAGVALDGTGATNTANIARMAMTIAADDKVKVVGDVDPALTYHFARGSLVNNDSLGGGLTRNSGEELGQYAINAMAPTNPNYEVRLVNGVLTIAPVPIPPSSPIIVPAFVDNGVEVLASQSPTSLGGLNYVLTDGSSAGSEGGKRKSTSELNINNFTVPSSTGPLDVFVVDTGINLDPVAKLLSLTN
ncbi:YDG domain-containing protein [Rhodoferax sp. PAMC 29310]|uniref:YDG domain-containing protein n=1 Tax=Rhodoferax sp. PAMC 29310 TaxID=2822760 RepID=UPI001B33B56C|nr:YDG domain-containing protein [Rhodoferax sp. PAMC 29310]